MGLIHYNFNSQLLRMKTNVNIIIPDRPYSGLCGLSRGYRTLYLLHGGGEDYTSFLRYSLIEQWANERGIAVVMPDGGQSCYADMVHGLPYFTYLSEELPSILEHVFPLSNIREDRFVCGFSMGALGAFSWALNRPDYFAAAAAMSGACDFAEVTRSMDQDIIKLTGDIFHCPFGGIDGFAGSRSDIVNLAQKIVSELPIESIPRLFSCIGTEDFMYEGSVKYKQMADQIGLPLQFEYSAGSHNWAFWNTWLPRVLDWMGLEKVS